MAKSSKWDKLVARIQALEIALARLVTGTPRKARKTSKPKVSKRKSAKPAKKKSGRAGKTAKSTAKTRKALRRKTARERTAVSLPILPGVPFGTL